MFGSVLNTPLLKKPSQNSINSPLLNVHIKDALIKSFDNWLEKQAKKCMKSCFLVCKTMYVQKVYEVYYTLS